MVALDRLASLLLPVIQAPTVPLFLAAIEPQVNTVAAAILSESGMEWLVDVAD